MTKVLNHNSFLNFLENKVTKILTKAVLSFHLNMAGSQSTASRALLNCLLLYT